MILLGNLNPQYIRHSFTMSVLDVQNNFIRKRITTKCRSQWSNGNVPDCGVRGPRFESHCIGSCMFIVKTTVIYSLGHRLHTLTAVPRSTQPSTLRGTIK